MYNREAVERLARFVSGRNGIADKTAIAAQTQHEFSLTRDRSVYYNEWFAIRFCKARSRSFANTVLALSVLQKYDNRPFIVCVVTPTENHLMLANSTFLKKISHSSQELRIDNIRGSFNGSDIMKEYGGEENSSANFEYLFTSHENYTFKENLYRLVETTNNIVPTGERFVPNEEETACIRGSVDRAVAFMNSNECRLLSEDLSERVRSVEKEIVVAAFIENNNLRGRIIEYLITSDGGLKNTIVRCLNDKEPLPQIFTADKLGDYGRDFGTYMTETDIKTKVLFLSSNPKGYNIEKLLQFLAESRSVYLICVVAINDKGQIKTQLCSIYNKQLLSGTRIIHHWAGRNSRGVTQYRGEVLAAAVEDFDAHIDEGEAQAFISQMLDMDN